MLQQYRRDSEFLVSEHINAHIKINRCLTLPIHTDKFSGYKFYSNLSVTSLFFSRSDFTGRVKIIKNYQLGCSLDGLGLVVFFLVLALFSIMELTFSFSHTHTQELFRGKYSLNLMDWIKKKWKFQLGHY